MVWGLSLKSPDYKLGTLKSLTKLSSGMQIVLLSFSCRILIRQSQKTCTVQHFTEGVFSENGGTDTIQKACQDDHHQRWAPLPLQQKENIQHRHKLTGIPVFKWAERAVLQEYLGWLWQFGMSVVRFFRHMDYDEWYFRLGKVFFWAVHSRSFQLEI